MISSRSLAGGFTVAALFAAAWAPSLHAAAAPVHPCLACSTSDVAVLRAQAVTPEGKQLVARMEYLSGYKLGQHERIKEAGYQAAGFAALGFITGNTGHVEKARAMVQKELLGYPLEDSLSLMERASRLVGAAVAFDFGYDQWPADVRDKVGAQLQDRAIALVGLAGRQGDSKDAQLDVVGYAAAGIALLAVRGESYARPEGAACLETCAKAVDAYVRDSISEQGVSRDGEGLKQVLLASGVIPFAIARGLAAGADAPMADRLQAALSATVHQTIPGAGAFRFGPSGAAIDRAGYFAAGLRVSRDPVRSSAVWMQQQIADRNSYDVTRPPHGVYALLNDPARMGGAASCALPLEFDDAASGLRICRNGWKGSEDVAVAVHGYAARSSEGATAVVDAGDFQVAGLGGRWASPRGPHATLWAPVYGHTRNVVGIPDRNCRLTGGAQVSRLAQTEDRIWMLSIVRTGTVTAVGQVEQPEKDKDKKRKDNVSPAPAGTYPFESRRTVAVDYSGLCGAPALVVVVDRVTCDAAVPLAWVWHSEAGNAASDDSMEEIRKKDAETLAGIDQRTRAGEITQQAAGEEIKALEAATKKAIGDARQKAITDGRWLLRSQAGSTMAMQVLTDPPGLPVLPEYNPPNWNFYHVNGMTACAVVGVISPQGARAPAIVVDGKGMAARVIVGQRIVSFDGAGVVFSANR